MTAEEFRALIVEEFGTRGEAFAVSYFDRSEFRPGNPSMLYPWSYVAKDRFRQDARRLLERENVKLGPALVPHLKKPLGRAA